MGVVGTAAGGVARVTVDGLLSENVRNGVTVTVKSGGRVIRQVTGNMPGDSLPVAMGHMKASAYSSGTMRFGIFPGSSGIVSVSPDTFTLTFQKSGMYFLSVAADQGGAAGTININGSPWTEFSNIGITGITKRLNSGDRITGTVPQTESGSGGGAYAITVLYKG